MHPRVRLHPVEPAGSPTLSTGQKVGEHRIQGISDEFVPPIVHLDELDSIIAVDDGDSIRMAQALAAGLGLGVGISSGANFLAALLAHEALSPDAVVVTVFPDSNKKYLSTALARTTSHRRTATSRPACAWSVSVQWAACAPHVGIRRMPTRRQPGGRGRCHLGNS